MHWIIAQQLEQLVIFAQLGEAEGWLREEERKQKNLKPYDNPSLLSSTIDERIETLRKPFTRLKNKKKPKPPPAPKADGKANETMPEDAASKADFLDNEAHFEEEPLLDGDEDLTGMTHCLRSELSEIIKQKNAATLFLWIR